MTTPQRPHAPHIGQIIKSDIANGDGIRLSVFLSGCRIHCKGCFQPQTWSFSYGHPVTDELHASILAELAKPQYDGITILGGEPFEPENQPYLKRLVADVRAMDRHRTIWVYSGCDLEELLDDASAHRTGITDEILDGIDVLVAGPFVQSKHDISLHYRGSSNQRVIDMNRTRALGYRTIVDYDPTSAFDVRRLSPQ